MSESIISIDTEAELQKIIARLNRLPDQIAAPKLLQNALSATARKVRKQMIQEAKSTYAIQNKKILKDETQGGPKVLTANSSNLSAAVRSRGPMQDIMAFMTRPNTRTGAAAAKVLASSSMTPLEKDGLKAFVTRFASGHTAIVQRTGPERLPLKKLLSPSVPHMLGNEAVRGKAETLAYELLQSEVEKRLHQVLE